MPQPNPQTDTETTAVWGIPILFEIKTCPKVSCLTAGKRFLLFKGPGPFKKSLKNCGNMEYLQAYQLTPSMAPSLMAGQYL